MIKRAIPTDAVTASFTNAGSQQVATKRLSLAAMLLMSCATLSACGGHEEVKAVDKVEEAAELARANAPKPENFEFKTTTPAPTDAATGDMAAPADAAPADAQAADAQAVNATTTDAAATDAQASAPALSADAGKALYERQCQACHAAGVLGAPKFGDKQAWSARIAQGKEVLYEHSAKGFKQMPAQASGDVSEAEVHAAVDYMVGAAS